jgi:lipopolysaccharide/colanic/teichoic acid biosynthesis glycosyltransferase
VITIILDSRPSYLDGDGSGLSLLTAPLGGGTVFSEIAGDAEEISDHRFRVLPTFEPSDAYARGLTQGVEASVEVIGHDALARMVHENEPSDALLLIDARHWPVGGYDLSSLVQRNGDARWALHGVAVGASQDVAREYVHCDDHGVVRRIGRYYHQVTWSRLESIAYSLVPLPAVEGVSLSSLDDLRAELTRRGLLSRDLPVNTGTIDISQESGLLAVNEQAVVALTSRKVVPGYQRVAHDVLVAKGCRIHPASRIVGPVVIQSGCVVEEGVTIIGPAVLGRNAIVRRGATVAQSVLARGAEAPAGETVCHRVAFGRISEPESATLREEGASPESFESTSAEFVRLAADAALAGSQPPRDDSRLKLLADTVIAAISLFILGPLFLLVAIVIRLESRGPIFFGHEREGKGGRVFKCWKFRTMRKDAHKMQRALYQANALDGPQFKLDNDPRVTRVGCWLRATNIDELPQLINVFLGQMSLVGPRPSPFRENQICIPWRRARLSVRPGITGLWQICRDQRSEGDFHQWIAYDIMYVRHMSLWLDLKIIIATVLSLAGMWSVPHSWLIRTERSNANQGSSGRRASLDKTRSTSSATSAGASG